MKMPIEFENNYKDIADIELWKLFKKKAKEEELENEFVLSVSEVCRFGIDKSKDIIRFFPNFTLHDITHIRNVCNWMTMLLGNRKEELSACEAAMLLMGACCHDVGMSVSEEQKKEIAEKVGDSERDQRSYVRKNHHELLKKHITPGEWQRLDNKGMLQRKGIRLTDLLNLCKSHGENLGNMKVLHNPSYDIKICAVLLRLADILDLDSTRAPQHLFEHMGLDSPEDFEHEISQLEWVQNRSGNFSIKDNKIILLASYDNPNIEHKVNDYVKWVEKELYNSTVYLSTYNGKWSDFRLPYKVDQSDQYTERIGYKGGDFKITMNQDRIIKLLTGENLYSDSCVFVRELLQNSIDAILWRDKIDPHFDAKNDGKITITTWYDEGGQGWFRIEDNGTGMDEKIINSYFLTAGNSYYTSDDFKNERESYAKDITYKPISRFGIGILSCFMSDEKNKIEVSTKRYSQDLRNQNSGIRLSVTGMKGYYSLSKEDEGYLADWQNMPVQSHESVISYRDEPGTTICVGMNLFSLGDYRNIREVIDAYVKFPEVKVEYFGPEGNREYWTKKQFINAVNELKNENEDNKVIICTQPIPDDEFEALEEELYQFEFEAAPELVITYFPLDEYANSENLCGMGIHIDVKVNCKEWYLTIGDKTCKIDLGAKVSYSRNLDMLKVDFDVDLTDYFERNELEGHEYYPTEYTMRMRLQSLCGIVSKYSESEGQVLGMVAESNHTENKGIISYNGVFASSVDIGYSSEPTLMIVLLNGDYAPEVNVARNEITNIPIECAFDLENIFRNISIVLSKYLPEFITYLYSSEYLYWSEKELRKLVEKHPEWEQLVLARNIKGYISVAEIKEVFDNGELIVLYRTGNTIYDNIALVLLKKYYKLYGEDYVVRLAEKTDNSVDTSGFPVQMFFEFSEEFSYLCKMYYGTNRYSPKHRFSKWLINNREDLEKEIPQLYRKILEIMIKSKDKKELIEGLNGRLRQLENYKNNMFNVTDKLLLTNSDLEDDD